MKRPEYLQYLVDLFDGKVSQRPGKTVCHTASYSRIERSFIRPDEILVWHHDVLVASVVGEFVTFPHLPRNMKQTSPYIRMKNIEKLFLKRYFAYVPVPPAPRGPITYRYKSPWIPAPW